MIGENIEVLRWIAAESSDSVVNRPIPVLNLVQHHRQNNNIVYGLILQQINLQNKRYILNMQKTDTVKAHKFQL